MSDCHPWQEHGECNKWWCVKEERNCSMIHPSVQINTTSSRRTWQAGGRAERAMNDDQLSAG